MDYRYEDTRNEDGLEAYGALSLGFEKDHIYTGLDCSTGHNPMLMMQACDDVNIEKLTSALKKAQQRCEDKNYTAIELSIYGKSKKFETDLAKIGINRIGETIKYIWQSPDTQKPTAEEIQFFQTATEETLCEVYDN